jgi:hypothetical protein
MLQALPFVSETAVTEPPTTIRMSVDPAVQLEAGLNVNTEEPLVVGTPAFRSAV